MDSAAEILFSFLKNAIYDPTNAKLDLNTLPNELNEFGQGLLYYVSCIEEIQALAGALSKGDLNVPVPSRGNDIAAPLKSLHASLKHLTWQAQQIAQGDYNQRVDFMGEFSHAFNTMTEQLAEREYALNEKIVQIQRKSSSLEQSNLLLTALMHYVPQQIIVINQNTHEILLMNDIAKSEIKNDPEYVDHILQSLSSNNAIDTERELEISYSQPHRERFFMIKTYPLEWSNTSAQVLAISDITVTKNRIEELEIKAYVDNMTSLYNRTYGMLTLDMWLHERRSFSLVFADLDNLKYVNDEFGHSDGDFYIRTAALHLKAISPRSVACRIGGDEFMLLIENMNHDQAQSAMGKVIENFQNDAQFKEKPYSGSISYGIIDVKKDHSYVASDLLSVADERMYEHKRMQKKARQQAAQTKQTSPKLNSTNNK